MNEAERNPQLREWGSNPNHKDESGFDFDHDRKYLQDGYSLLKDTVTDDAKPDEQKYTDMIKNDGLMSEMAGRFYVLDSLSKTNESINDRKIRYFMAITFASAILFSVLVMLSNSAVMAILYVSIFIIANVFMWGYDRSKVYEKYLSYRMIAESLRVEFYWGILGINDTASGNSYNFTKHGMSWFSTIMKGCNSFFVNDYSRPGEIDIHGRVDVVQSKWVESQRSSNKSKTEGDLSEHERLQRWNSRFSMVILALSIFSIFAAIFLVDNVSEIICTFEDPINGEMLDLTWYSILKIILISAVNISALIVMKSNMLKYTSKDQVQASRMLLDSASSKLKKVQNTSDRKMIQGKLSIFHELGVFIIQEYSDLAVEMMDKSAIRSNSSLSIGNWNSENASELLDSRTK